MRYIIDISSAGVQHEQFNISFSKLIQNTYPNEQLQFLGEKYHTQILSSELDAVTFREIFVYTKRGGFKEFIRAYYQFKVLSGLIKSLHGSPPTSLYILLIHPFAHFLFTVFGKAHFPIFIVKHGELESVKFNKHFLNKIWGIFQKFALSKVRPNISYVILGQSIYKNLVNVLPAFKKQRAIVLDHPYPFSPVSNQARATDRIVFSTLGVATKAKNTHYFFELSAEAKRLRLPYKFNVCGRVYKNMEPYLHDNVNYKPSFASLSRAELNEMILQSDFTVFYYENSDYSLCASGSFWDAINAEIPMLYVNNDYFDYYASIAGPIGIAFENPDQLNAFIISGKAQRLPFEEQYQTFIQNIRHIKYVHMSAQNLSDQLVTATGPKTNF